MRNPVMFVVGVGSVLTTILFFKDFGSSSSDQNVFTGARRRVPVVHRAVRELRRGGGRGPGEGAGRHAATHTVRDRRARPPRRRDASRSVASTALDVDDLCVVTRGRDHPERRRRHRGHRERRRVGDHRRIGAGDPRVGRRPLGGHRRHARPLRRDRRAHHRAAGRDVPRPHDRAGRGHVAAEDAERDRAEHPAGRLDDHLPAHDGHAAALRDVRRMPSRTSSSSSRSSSASSRRRSAGCCRRSASRGWTVSSAATCWP